jgi:hypothetical protein
MEGKPVDWWFVFKFSGASFPDCAQGTRTCAFGGTVQHYSLGFSQQFIFASNDHPTFQMGIPCLGDTTADPVGATFDQVYNGSYSFVIWNDQFYNDPDLAACNGETFCDFPWGHSKGVLAWDADGNGFLMQVSTPNWPGAGNKQNPRPHNGNTLGCITRSNGVPQDNILLSQHFFATKLSKGDLVTVLKALVKASVVTAPNAAPNSNSQIIWNGGPSDIQDLVSGLGSLSSDTTVSIDQLSNGVQLITKPSSLHVPPWQMVSAVLGKKSLVVATFLTDKNPIDDTPATRPDCWDVALPEPGAVTNARSGTWTGTQFGLLGAENHAKIGVSAEGDDYILFGDLNQEGALSGNCDLPHNNRGGLFFVVKNASLATDMRRLMNVR